MNRSLFSSFTPADDSPLVVELINHAHAHGFSSELRFDFWDFSLFEDADKPVCVVKSLKNAVGSRALEQILVEPTPFKLLLLEDSRAQPQKLYQSVGFLSMSGAGVYVRGQGWLTLPGDASYRVADDLALVRSKRWARDGDGIWRKRCTKCGVSHGQDGFYANARGDTVDPYVHWCKACWAEANKRAYAARKAKKAAPHAHDAA